MNNTNERPPQNFQELMNGASLSPFNNEVEKLVDKVKQEK